MDSNLKYIFCEKKKKNSAIGTIINYINYLN